MASSSKSAEPEARYGEASLFGEADVPWPSDTDAVTQQVMVTLRQITRAIDLHSRALLHQFGLTSPQLATLQAICREQPITAGHLARTLHLGQPTVTGILDRLERRGLIARMRGERDRRSVMLTLTASGQDVLSGAPSLLAGFGQQLGGLKPWERAQILSNLQRVADMLEQSTHIGPAEQGSHVPYTASSPTDRPLIHATPPASGRSSDVAAETK